MKNYQKRILSFGQRVGKSWLFIALLGLIAITYFADFVSKTIKIYHDVDKLNPLDIFNTAGLLAFSLGAGYAAFIQVKSKDIKSKRIFLLVWIAISWGLFSALMKIYPWNFGVAISFLILGLLACRRSQWELVEKKWAEENQS